MIRPLRLTTWAAATAITMAALTSCTSSGADVETKSEAEATRIVQQKADQVVTLVGNTSLTDPALSPGPCTGKNGEAGSDISAVQGV
ncbi:hypothetical protein AB0J80_03545 [Actinoplanes sp. NPDC049548]|uniref:hypothetical protein n=1 Tax=Actinoplanes sp. NPDC049548 TaxID=3155152 RepID=UPI00343C1206